MYGWLLYIVILLSNGNTLIYTQDMETDDKCREVGLPLIAAINETTPHEVIYATCLWST